MIKTKFIILLLLIITVIAGCDNSDDTVSPIPTEVGDEYVFKQNELLGRGVNLGNALEAPKEGEWGVFLKEEYFALIKYAGFNSIRVPIKWSAHSLKSSPYTIDVNFFSRIDWVINQAIKYDLAVIINIHHYDEIMVTPASEKERFLKLWEQISERYKNQSNKVFFEILNEPNSAMTAQIWDQYYKEALTIIRKTNPIRTVLIGLSNWGGVNGLSGLTLPANENNVIVSFHYYNPFEFSHQGADWVNGSNAWLGRKWNGTTSEKNAVINDFNIMISWANSKKVPLNLGEFGAFSKADIDSRIKWTAFIASQAVASKISFHYWEFCSGFGIYDLNTNKFNDGLLKALIPSS